MAYTTFSSSLTTTTFDSSSMKRFIHSACTACMRGLLSSIKQHVKELFTLSLLDTPCASFRKEFLDAFIFKADLQKHLAQ